MGITARIDAETIKPQQQPSAVLPAPTSGKLETYSGCNLGCSYCSRTITKQAANHMDDALYTKIVTELYDAGVRSFGAFFIGEPFMDARLPDRIREAKEIGMEYVFVTTNGTMATPEKIRAAMAAGLNSIKFSMNYADAAQFAAIANVTPRLFDRTLSNLIAARRIRDEGGYDCGIYASSILYDGEQREKMQALVEAILPYVDEHYYLPAFDMRGAGTNAGLDVQAGNPGRVGALRPSLPCWSLWSYHVRHDGKLIACCFGDGGDERMVMGDLREQSFMGAWNSDRFVALRQAHLDGDVRGTPCEACVAGG